MNKKPLMDEKLTAPIKEAGYLFTQKSHRYRPIIRYLYERHLAYSPFVFPSEIFGHLSQYADFEGYTEDELLVDLETLVERNNLEQIQDKTNVKSIEEYKKKRYRYKCTSVTIELEKTLIGMETTLQSIRGSLERSLPYNLYEQLNKLQEFKSKGILNRNDLEEINGIWESVFERFKKLAEDASDYLSHINTDTIENVMKTDLDAFLVFKDLFTDYLQNFIGSLRKNTERIRKILLEMSEEVLHTIVRALIEYQKAIPRLDAMPDDSVFYENYTNKWNNLKTWFISTSETDCYVHDLEKQTIEMIRKITKMAQQAAERTRTVRSRESDFLHLARLVQYMDSQEKANELHSLLFGFEHTRHIRVKNQKDTDHNHVTIWKSEPSQEELKVRKNPTRTQRKVEAVKENIEEKRKLMEEYQKEQRKQQDMINKLFAKEVIEFKELDVVTPFQRQVMLGWIGAAIGAHDRPEKTDIYIGKTEGGKKYQLIKQSNEMVTMRCEDGNLKMPDFKIVFLG